jgi:hypothetical protein
MNRSEQEQMRRSILALRYELAGLMFQRKLGAASAKAGFRPDQARDERGRWTDEGGRFSRTLLAPTHIEPNKVSAIFADVASIPLKDRIALLSHDEPTGIVQVGAKITYDTARTGIPSVDDTTEKLSKILLRVMDTSDFIPEQSPQAYGVAVHVAFAGQVKIDDLPGIGRSGVEQSFKLKDVARYGLAGSIRTDVVLRNVAQEIIAIYDLKTGGAVLSPSRADELREHSGAAPYTPVIELHFERGSRLKHEPFTYHPSLNPAAGEGYGALRRYADCRSDRLRASRLRA